MAAVSSAYLIISEESNIFFCIFFIKLEWESCCLLSFLPLLVLSDSMRKGMGILEEFSRILKPESID